MSKSPNSQIYLDYNATTPCAESVVTAMVTHLREEFGNPSSSLHSFGKRAHQAIRQAREQTAEFLNALPEEIFFGSSATECCNLAILGIAKKYEHCSRRSIVTTAAEHDAVLRPCEYLKKQGWDVKILPLLPNGQVNMESAVNAITSDTLLVSVQLANNEVGALHPVKELAAIAREQNAFIHCDASQAAGKIPIDVEDLEVDLLCISGHKMYGPKGAGALFIRGGSSGTPLEPLYFGAGQERAIRPGTENVPAIAGLGEACRIASELVLEDEQRISFLRNTLEKYILHEIPGSRINGGGGKCLPNTLSVLLPHGDAEAFILRCPELAISTGSACHSGALEPSRVLTAMGLTRDAAYRSLRISLGRPTTDSEIAQAASAIKAAWQSLQADLTTMTRFL